MHLDQLLQDLEEAGLEVKYVETMNVFNKEGYRVRVDIINLGELYLRSDSFKHFSVGCNERGFYKYGDNTLLSWPILLKGDISNNLENREMKMHFVKLSLERWPFVVMAIRRMMNYDAV